MPRPGKPLISRSAAVRAAIDIIGADGLQSFTMPRLAAEMGVKVPSLYHHFRDRADILLAVVQYVAGAAVVASGSVPGPDWPEHFVALATSFRRSFVCYKNTAPLLLHYRPRDLLPGGYEAAAQFLHRSGVPVAFHIRILDGMETLLIGTAICEIMNPFFDGGTIFRNVDLNTQSALAVAVDASGLSAEGLLEVKVRAFLTGVTADSHKPNVMRY